MQFRWSEIRSEGCPQPVLAEFCPRLSTAHPVRRPVVRFRKLPDVHAIRRGRDRVHHVNERARLHGRADGPLLGRGCADGPNPMGDGERSEQREKNHGIPG